MSETTDTNRPSGGDCPSPEPIDTIGRLLRFAEELDPFLDIHGRACCRMPGPTSTGRMAWPLDSKPVLSLLTYRYRERYGHEHIPSRNELAQAIALVRGGLWHRCPRETHPEPIHAATIRVIERAVATKGDFVGSASEALGLLQRLVKQDPELIQAGESLPASADQLGIVLNRVALVLRESGIVVYRPRRTDVKRLWAWERMTPAADAPDTPDTGDAKASPNGNAFAVNEIGNADASDTALEHRLTTIYNEEGHPHESTAA